MEATIAAMEEMATENDNRNSKTDPDFVRVPDGIDQTNGRRLSEPDSTMFPYRNREETSFAGPSRTFVFWGRESMRKRYVSGSVVQPTVYSFRCRQTDLTHIKAEWTCRVVNDRYPFFNMVLL